MDIFDAIARGSRYPSRPSRFDGDGEYDDPDDDECDIRPPRGRLPLPPAQVASLQRAVEAGLLEHGCDNTLRAAQAWARREGVRWARLRDALEERSGFCDCEVLLNALPPPG
jgi:Protein of unknown function (DUF2695)